MPLEQAYLVAESFVKSFGLSRKSLSQWKERNEGKSFSSDRFEASPVLDFYPVVSLTIAGSQNKLYPWVVRLNMQWGWREHEDWDEERVWQELPPPEIPEISLNPPSGLAYDRQDAYEEALKKQAEHERELAEEGVLPPHLQSTPEKQPEESGADTDNGNDDNLNPSLLIIIVGIIGAIVVTLLGVFWFFKAKR
jgi:hypothetical protein